MSLGTFSKYDSQDLNRIAAKGILEKLRPIRQRLNYDFTARRIIWELIQNAKDNAAVCNKGNVKVDIKIELNKNNFVFIHNNGFFTNENIRGLVRRYSSSEKDRDYNSFDSTPSTTGRFGTGFMTTHLLSEKVTTKGVFLDEDGKFKSFILPIDRSGENEKEIIRSIESSFLFVENYIKESPNLQSDISKFNTEFIYEIDERGIEVAQIALKEFYLCVGPTLINLPTIEKIEILEFNKKTTFKLLIDSQSLISDLNIQLAELQIQENSKSTESKFFIVINDTKLKLILPIDIIESKYLFKPLDPKIPKLFLDFPLIGTENLNIPFIISSPFFEPTETRDGVSLTANDDKDTKTNSELLKYAAELYTKFLDEVSKDNNWNNLYNLARIKHPDKKEWINPKWYDESFLKPIRKKLLYVPIVQINSQLRASIKNLNNEDQVYFPYASKKEIRDNIRKLSIDLFPDNIPIKEHIDDWYDIIWDDCFKLDISFLTKSIANKKDLNTLISVIKKSEECVINWLNDFYYLLILEGKFIDEIIKGNYSIFLNQNGILKKKSEIYIDDDIEDVFKHILQILNIDIKDSLLHKDILFNNEHKNTIPFLTKDQDFVIEQINKSLDNNKNSSVAINYLISLFSEDPDFPKEREFIYHFNRRILGKEIPEKIFIKKWNKSIWAKIDNRRINKLLDKISQTKNLTALKNLINEESIETTLTWLQSFINFLIDFNYSEKLNSKEYPILPNQNGEFRIKDDLFLEDGVIDDELKNISKKLGFDIRNELLHKNITLSLPSNRVRSNQYLAEEIARRLKPIIKDTEKRSDYLDLFKELYVWMTQNPKFAQEIFGEIYEKRFLLMSDDLIISNLNKAQKLDELLVKSGLTLDQIFEKLDKNQKRLDQTIYTIDNHFEIEFEPLKEELLEKTIIDNSEYFPPQENLSFEEKLLQLINHSNSPWRGFIYHFTHLENAISILKQKKILSRNKAKFKDSAGSSFIYSTLNQIKNYVRFYFRPLTPTQYYNEGLGKETKYGDLPQCPVMIFFKFELKEALEKFKNRCYVSNGNLRHYPQTNFGNTYEFLKSFDFKHLFCNYGECDHQYFINASQQEFIVQDEFDFSNFINYHIICRTETDKNTLLTLVEFDKQIIDKIYVDSSFYYRHNRFVEVEKNNQNIKVKFSSINDKIENIKIISTRNFGSNYIKDIIKSPTSVELETNNEGQYQVFYFNQRTNQEWLIYEKRNNNN